MFKHIERTRNAKQRLWYDLESGRSIDLTTAVSFDNNKENGMSEPSKHPESRDSIVDAWAIFIMIVIAVSTAVFWVSHQ